MNFMDKFSALADKFLVPIANKISTQRHFSAIKDGMTVSVALSIVGGFCLIIGTPPFRPEQLSGSGFFNNLLMGWYNWAQTNSYAIKLPYFMTMALMGLFICFAIAYHLAKHYKIDPLSSSVVATVIFLIVAAPMAQYVPVSSLVDGATVEELTAFSGMAIPANFLDANGIFTAILVAIGVVELINFLYKKDIRIKMPEGVPPAIASSFDAIIPLILAIVIFYSFSLVVQSFSAGALIPSVIMKMLAPAMSGMDSLPGILFITFVAQLFWFFGLHGASITQFVRLPFMNQYIAANATAYENGLPMEHFFTQPFWSYIIAIGGGGSTLALVILMARSRSKQLKELGKISLVPGLFNINEPIIFGTPMVLNPVMMIPFIFVPLINTTIAYSLLYFGVIQKGFLTTPWTTPAPLGAALGFADWKAAILVVFLILLDMALYYPFFKTYEKMKVEEETSVVAQDA